MPKLDHVYDNHELYQILYGRPQLARSFEGASMIEIVDRQLIDNPRFRTMISSTTRRQGRAHFLELASGPKSLFEDFMRMHAGFCLDPSLIKDFTLLKTDYMKGAGKDVIACDFTSEPLPCKNLDVIFAPYYSLNTITDPQGRVGPETIAAAVANTVGALADNGLYVVHGISEAGARLYGRTELRPKMKEMKVLRWLPYSYDLSKHGKFATYWYERRWEKGERGSPTVGQMIDQPYVEIGKKRYSFRQPFVLWFPRAQWMIDLFAQHGCELVDTLASDYLDFETSNNCLFHTDLKNWEYLVFQKRP